MLKSIAAAVAATAMLASGALAKDNITVGYILIDLSNPFHVGQVQGAKEAARREGFKLDIASGEGDVTKQIRAMEDMINQHVDVISINFIDAKAFGPTMKKAEAAGIPVVCLHSDIPGCTATLGFDERHTGNIVGEYAVELLKKRYDGTAKGEVANLEGLLGQGLNTDRSGGFTDVMAKYPDIKVVAQEPTSWDPTKAVSITENWMTAYPHLDLIYGNSDSLTVPASKVLKRDGKQKQVMLVSVDGTEPGLKAVKDGTMECTVMLAPQYAGYWKAYFPYLVAKKENDGRSYLIRGVLVTKANVDAALKLANDQVNDMQKFPFKKPLTDIVKMYSQN